jgi:hypothetical protein
LVTVLVFAAAAALGANPTKGGTYEGQDSKEVKLVVKVSSNGKAGKVDLFCSSTHISAIKSFPIKRGAFYAIRNQGSIKLFSVKGRFTSAKTATVTASLKAECAGGDHHITLALAS